MDADSRSVATDPRVVQFLDARRVSFARKRRGLEFHVVSAKPVGTQWRSMYTRIGGKRGGEGGLILRFLSPFSAGFYSRSLSLTPLYECNGAPALA